MKISELFEIKNPHTETVMRLLKSGKVRIPRDQDGAPTLKVPSQWKEFFVGEHDYGIDLDSVDWDLVHREFYS